MNTLMRRKQCFKDNTNIWRPLRWSSGRLQGACFTFGLLDVSSSEPPCSPAYYFLKTKSKGTMTYTRAGTNKEAETIRATVLIGGRNKLRKRQIGGREEKK
jgi:hypothetical protein